MFYCSIQRCLSLVTKAGIFQLYFAKLDQKKRPKIPTGLFELVKISKHVPQNDRNDVQVLLSLLVPQTY